MNLRRNISACNGPTALATTAIWDRPRRRAAPFRRVRVDQILMAAGFAGAATLLNRLPAYLVR